MCFAHFVQINEDGSMDPIYKETEVVGLKISTKSVGYNRRNDITDEYKHREGNYNLICSFNSISQL